MTNGEHYGKEILAIVKTGGFCGINADGVPQNCGKLNCRDCQLSVFNTHDNLSPCRTHIAEWWDAPYDELAEWRNIPIDTPILVRDSREDEWQKRYFAGLNEYSQYYKFQAWDYGATSWSHGNDAPVSWQYAKLANQEED